MTGKHILHIVENMASGMDVKTILEEQEKVRNSDIKERIDEVLLNKLTCPKCHNDLMYDSDEEVVYCPIDGDLGEIEDA